MACRREDHDSRPDTRRRRAGDHDGGAHCCFVFICAAAAVADIKLHTVKKNLSGSLAKLDHWLVGPDGKSLSVRTLSRLSVTDPYLGSYWQVSLLGELISLARAAGEP